MGTISGTSKMIAVSLVAGAIAALIVFGAMYLSSAPPSEPAVPAATDGEAPPALSPEEAAEEIGPSLSESDETEALEQDLDATNLTGLDAELEDVDREFGP
ncbi:MAG: hypothetical protein HY475_03545 [Candidatus Terrybacteria bacterium]|nr:hypothetical protein [Candidatus Terrybacteria bacterium]